MAKYNIDGMIRHKNDLISLLSWVEEMRCLEHNPVLLLKRQGYACIEGMDTNGLSLSNDDLLLVVQTQFQKEMLQTFGCHAVCMDSTHKTNAYDFFLTTLLVIDDYGEGIPVG